MIPRRRNPAAPHRWQYERADGTWDDSLQQAEWSWRENNNNDDREASA